MTHWALVVVYFEQRVVMYLDSMAKSGDKYLMAVFRYIQDEHISVYGGTSLPQPESWDVRRAAKSVPQQRNGT